MQSNQVSGENNRSDFKGRQLKVYLEGGESFIQMKQRAPLTGQTMLVNIIVENMGNTKVTIVLTEVKSLQ